LSTILANFRPNGAFLLDYIVNLFGNGIRYWILSLDDPKVKELNSFRVAKAMRWDQLIFDLTILKKHKIDHWSSLAPETEQFGLMLTAQDKIEVKTGSKFLQKFKASELIQNDTLFPLYQTETNTPVDLSSNGPKLLMVQYETGLIGKFSFSASKFYPDQICYHISNPFTQSNDQLLSWLSYDGLKMKKNSEDTVIRGLRIFEL
jgi:hypothetical protein